MNKIIVGLILVLSFSTWGADSKSNYCQDIKIVNGRIMTTITVEGIRGNLSIPALIDTGADMSVIPQSIAEGIGYKYKHTKEFSTVGAKRKFKVIAVKKISMLGMDFDNVEVVIEPKNGGNERALIGMSELSQTSFSVKDDIFTICSKKGSNLVSDVSDDDFESHANLILWYQNLCELDNGGSCFDLGGMYYQGKGVKQDNFKAVKYFKKACELDYGTGCFGLGVMYDEGKGVKQDNFKAAEHYKKACELDNGDGCNNLGVMYDNGQGVRQSKQKALKYYGKACDLKDKSGCKNYARLKKN